MDTRGIGKILTRGEEDKEERPDLFPNFTTDAQPASSSPPFTTVKEEEEKEKLPSLQRKKTALSPPHPQLLHLQVRAVNCLRTIVKSLEEQFRVRPYDQEFDRERDTYRRLLAERFNFSIALVQLEQNFNLCNLDTTLIKKARVFCNAVEMSLLNPSGKSPSEKALVEKINAIIGETELFCRDIDSQYINNIHKQRTSSFSPAPESEMMSLEEALFEPHLQFCVAALQAITVKRYDLLTTLALEYSATFSTPLAQKKIIPLSTQGLSMALNREYNFNQIQLQIGIRLFCDTLEYAKTRNQEHFVNYILNSQPKDKEWTREDQSTGTELQQFHLHKRARAGGSLPLTPDEDKKPGNQSKPI